MITVDNLFNIESFTRFSKQLEDKSVQDALASKFNDAGYNGVVLARNLTAVDPTILEKRFPGNVFLNELGVTINNTGGYVNAIDSLRNEPTGDYKDSTDLDTSKGRIGVAGDVNTIKVYNRTASSSWTEVELQQAALQNQNLVQLYLNAHNTIYQRNLDQIGFTGVGATKGILNYASWSSDGATAAATAATAAQLYTDLADLITAQWSQSSNTPEYMANVVVMPTSVYNIISKKIMDSTASNSDSVLMALQKNFPTVKFVGTFRAEAAQLSGTSATLAISTNPECMQFRLPVPLTIGEIIKKASFTFDVEGYYRVAGIDILEDFGGYLLTGL